MPKKKWDTIVNKTGEQESSSLVERANNDGLGMTDNINSSKSMYCMSQKHGHCSVSIYPRK